MGIKKLKCNINNIIIFEDSISGYLSALRSGIKNIILYTNNETDSEIQNIKCKKINTYENIDILSLLNDNIIDDNYYVIEIKSKLNYLPIKNVKFKNENLKTGYICDINSYELVYNDNTKSDIILKISNFDNELSKTAIKLDMYKNESFFYENISNIININIPKNYGIINYKDKDGIILEDLRHFNGEFNLDLNNNIVLLLNVITEINKMHSRFKFNNQEDIIKSMKKLKKCNQILFYKELINKRFNIFIEKNKLFFTNKNIEILNLIYENFNNILDYNSTFPLSFVHGDFKSPNIFYKNNSEPIMLDWQYIHLNKPISDIIFLLVESIKFDKKKINLVLDYYFILSKTSYDIFFRELKMSLCIFPFFVMVWFNSEKTEKLLDKTFPIKFMKNLLEYYNYFLDYKDFNFS
jgi:thiamine kinase-like enzyme